MTWKSSKAKVDIWLFKTKAKINQVRNSRLRVIGGRSASRPYTRLSGSTIHEEHSNLLSSTREDDKDNPFSSSSSISEPYDQTSAIPLLLATSPPEDKESTSNTFTKQEAATQIPDSRSTNTTIATATLIHKDHKHRKSKSKAKPFHKQDAKNPTIPSIPNYESTDLIPFDPLRPLAHPAWWSWMFWFLLSIPFVRYFMS